MQNVTTKKFAEMCGVSDANIRGLIGRGKIIASKDVNGNHIIDLDLQENRNYYDSRKITQQSAQQNETVTQQTNESLLKELTERNETLAIEYGKYKQLESNLIERKNDVKHWEDKYFELQSKYEKLVEDNASLRKELELRNQLATQEQLKKEKWWNKKII